MKTLGIISRWSLRVALAGLAVVGFVHLVDRGRPAPESCLAPLDASLVSVAVVRLENRSGHLYADLELADSDSERLESVYAGQAVNGLYRLKLPLHLKTVQQVWTFAGRRAEPWDTWPTLRTQVLNAIQDAKR